MKPNFLIIGAAKCGTTSLYELLRRHPEIGMSRIKEPKYFSHDDLYARGMDWYESHFEGLSGKKAIGEASPSYSVRDLYPKAAERISRDLPGVRAIYIVRHPIDRLESVWMQTLRSGTLTESFESKLRRGPYHIESTRYWKQFNVHRRLLGDRQLLLLFLEDLNTDAAGVLRRCFRFLRVDPEISIDDATPRNAWRGSQDRQALALLRRAPVFSGLRDASPRALRTLGRRILKRPIRERKRLSPTLRRWVWEQLSEDANALLTYAGKPLDFWGPEPLDVDKVAVE